jgi:hypothetical protein
MITKVNMLNIHIPSRQCVLNKRTCRDDPGTCGHGSTTKPTTALRKSKGGDALLTCVAHPQTCDYG